MATEADRIQIQVVTGLTKKQGVIEVEFSTLTLPPGTRLENKTTEQIRLVTNSSCRSPLRQNYGVVRRPAAKDISPEPATLPVQSDPHGLSEKAESATSA